MTFSEAITACMGNYAIFRGRARRAEFWWFLLFCILMHWAASLTAAVSGAGWDFDQRFHHTFFERPVFDRISDDGKEASSINIPSGWARGGHLTWNEEGEVQLGRGRCAAKDPLSEEGGCIEWRSEPGQRAYHHRSHREDHGEGPVLAGLVSLALILPLIAAAVQRLLDTGRSGWWLLLFLTVIGNIWLIWWLARPSQGKKNRHGPKPAF
jgi:uncharacterized membrane protein YhaH (DUF805 family)